MRLIPKTKDSIALTMVTAIAIGFFVAGIFDILDYFIVQMLLLLSFVRLLSVGISMAIENDRKENRPEDKLQDDSH